MSGFAPGQPKSRLRRQPRPGQAPPQGACNGNKRPRADGENREAPCATQSTAVDGDQSAYMEKMVRQASEFNERRPENIKKYFTHFEKAKAFTMKIHDHIARAIQDEVRQVLDTEKAAHPCCASSNSQACLSRERVRKILVLDLDHRVPLKVPNYICAQCKEIVTVHPYAVDCVPTAPTEYCKIWIRRSTVNFFRDLHKSNGLSADAFVHALNNNDRRFWPAGTKFVVEDGHSIDREYPQGLTSPQLTTADLEAWKVEHEAHDVKPVTNDPFVGCPVCATSNRETLNNGTLVPEGRLSVMTDAMNAADRYKSAGGSQTNNLPTTKLFLADAARTIMEETESGTLASSARRNAAAAAEAVEEVVDTGTCTTALHCNRECIKQKRGEMDIQGTVAIVCSHVFPGEGCCVPMTTPECHHYYDVLLDYLLRARTDVKDIYLDLMCRYHGKLKLIIEKLRNQHIFPNNADDINMLLPIMHAFDHNQDCQLKFSGLYAEGVGRRVGEQTEVLWADVKPFFKLARYMTSAHWWDEYNCLFWLLTRRKQERFPSMLYSRIKRINLKVEEFKKALVSLRSEAATHGVADLEAALPFLDASNTTPAAALSLGAKYVEVLLKLRSLDNLGNDKVLYPLLMPRNAGMVVHATATNDAAQVKLRRMLAQYQMELNLEVGTDWAAESQEYKDALKELCKHFMQQYALIIENQVFKLVVVVNAKKRTQSGHNADKYFKRLQSLTKNIRKLLEVYFSWEAYDTDRSPTQVTEILWRNALNRNFPWSNQTGDSGGVVDSPNGSEAAQKYFTLRYHTAKNQLQRTVEEVDLLKKEVVRLFNWCEERIQLVDEKIDLFKSKIAELEEASESDTLIAAEKALISIEISVWNGKIAVHEAEKGRLHCIYEEARERW